MTYINVSFHFKFANSQVIIKPKTKSIPMNSKSDSKNKNKPKHYKGKYKKENDKGYGHISLGFAITHAALGLNVKLYKLLRL